MKGVPTVQKKCVICGQLFLPAKPSSKICSRAHYAKCPICGKQMLWNTTRKVEPCSKQCRKEQTKQHNLLKYGVEHPMQSKEVQQHHKQAMLEKYGVESPLQSPEIRQRAIDTNREKFGADWALGSAEVRRKSAETMTQRYGGPTTLQSYVLSQKVSETCLETYGYENAMKNSTVRNKVDNTNFMRYGVTNAAQNTEVRTKINNTRIERYGQVGMTKEMLEKAKQKWLEHYGVDNPSKCPEIKAKIEQTLVERYGEDYITYLQRNSPGVISNINKTFMNRLEKSGLHGEFEFAGIGRYSYDIVLPEQKVLFEIDPSYTHNTVGNHWVDHGIDKNYHKKKSDAAREAGYRCIHVFDWDDWNSIIDLIKPKVPIYARKCKIYKLQPKVADEFLSKYHLQGTVKGQLLCLGLVYEGELVQVMTFGQPRYNKKYYAELLRLCTKPGVAVVGGAERLFKFATNKLCIENIISYCDLSKFNGDVYSRIGMHLDHCTEPQEIWSKNDRKVTANLLRQRGFDQMFGTNYGKGTDNNELMLADGWLPVYDCGQAVYTF